MKKLDYAIVFVSEMARSVAFYRDVLELPLRFESPHWTEFGTEVCTVALHPAEAPSAAAPASAGRCHLGFQVPDIAAFHRRMESLGVTCIQPPKREQFGTLAVYADPDGLPITIMQP